MQHPKYLLSCIERPHSRLHMGAHSRVHHLVRSLLYGEIFFRAHAFRVVEINVGIMCGCFPAMPPILRSVRSVLSSSKLSLINSPLFRWRRLRSGDSEAKPPSTGRMRVTLGSRVNGKGQFLTMKSLFSRESNETESMDLTLRGDEPSIQTTIRASDSQDLESGLRKVIDVFKR